MKGKCKFFDRGKCSYMVSNCDCPYKYPEFEDCEDYEEEED